MAITALVIAAIPLVTAVVEGIAEVASIDHFCWPCFWEGVKEAAPGAFLFGLGFGLVTGAAMVLCLPVGIGLLIAGAAIGTYAVLDEYFGGSSGLPFSEMTDDEKSKAFGRLTGGSVAGTVGGVLGGLAGRGLGLAIKGGRRESRQERKPGRERRRSGKKVP